MTKKTTRNGERNGTKPKKKTVAPANMATTKKKATMPANTAKKKTKKPPQKGGNSKQRGTEELIPVTIKNHKDKHGGHPHIIVDNVDNCHVSVGLSTKPKKGKNSPNYKLEVSPLGDGKQSYARRQGTVAPKKEYERPRNGKMTPKDHAKIQEYGAKAKKKYLDKNKKSSELPNT